MTDSSLAGKHAVVTGGSRGIGAAIVRELAGQGAAVTLMGRDQQQLNSTIEKLQSNFKTEFCAVRVDVTDHDAVAAAFKESTKHMGDCGILINNAGAADTAPFVNTDWETWTHMIGVNLNSVYLCTRQVLPTMVKNESGVIVNISSTAGVQGYPYVTAYSAAKHGVVGFTKSLALETKKYGIRVNAVCPAYTNTDLLSTSARKVSQKTGQPIDVVMERYANMNPKGRLVEPQEVAQKVSWLCAQEQASVTGGVFIVDGSSEGTGS